MISNHFWIGVGPTMSNGGGGVVRGEDDAADCCRKALYRASRTARIPRTVVWMMVTNPDHFQGFQRVQTSVVT